MYTARFLLLVSATDTHKGYVWPTPRELKPHCSLLTWSRFCTFAVKTEKHYMTSRGGLFEQLLHKLNLLSKVPARVLPCTHTLPMSFHKCSSCSLFCLFWAFSCRYKVTRGSWAHLKHEQKSNLTQSCPPTRAKSTSRSDIATEVTPNFWRNMESMMDFQTLPEARGSQTQWSCACRDCPLGSQSSKWAELLILVR